MNEEMMTEDGETEERTPQERKRMRRICFMAGFTLSFLGLLIGFAIGRTEGVLSALRGMLWNFVFVLAFYCGMIYFISRYVSAQL